MSRTAIFLLLATASGGCDGSNTEATNSVNAEHRPDDARAADNASLAIAPGEPGGLPDDRALVEEGPIDSKSSQGAGQVLQSYAALLEQGRLAEARLLWTEGGSGSGLSEEGFEKALGKYAEIHAEIGGPGAVEGAAGSAYVEIPVRFYGRLKGGRQFSSIGTATLRRVNDVPGSTEAQRRWHIHKMEMQPPL